MRVKGTDYTADGTLKRIGKSSVFRAVDCKDDFVFAVFFVNSFDLQHDSYLSLENKPVADDFSFGVAIKDGEIYFFCFWIFI